MATLHSVRNKLKEVPILERPISATILRQSSRSKPKSDKRTLLPSPLILDSKLQIDENKGVINPQRILLENQESNYSKVYEINLHASDLRSIDNLNKFRRLRKLDLSCNHISKIENLDSNTDLRELKLYDNEITSVDNLDGLSQLSHLQLQHNRIKNIGKGLAKLKNLTELRLDSNNLTTVLASEIHPCHRITYLDIGNNHLEDISSILSLPNLQELHAPCNRLKCLVVMGNCKKLQELDVSHNNIADIRGLKDLPNLQVLNVSNNRLPSLRSIGKVKSLLELHAAYNRISDISSLYAYYPHLEVLNVSDNKILHIEHLECLRQCSRLVELYITGNPFSDQEVLHKNHFSVLHSALPNLEILDKVYVKRASHQSGAPLMRPMSAASVITSRQVESQISNISIELKNIELDISKKFEDIRSTYESLPACSPRNTLPDCGPLQHEVMSLQDDTVNSDTVSVVCPGEGGECDPGDVPSRCSSRNRIMVARSYAAEHF